MKTSRSPKITRREHGRPRKTAAERKAPPHPQQLLFSRAQSASILGVSVSTIKRMEVLGLLRCIRPTGLPTGQAFNPKDDVLAVAQARGATDAA